MFDLRE